MTTSDKRAVYVMGEKICTVERGAALRYAQGIREAMWQCMITGERWQDGATYQMTNLPKNSAGEHPFHICGDYCLDSRTDDDVEVQGE